MDVCFWNIPQNHDGTRKLNKFAGGRTSTEEPEQKSFGLQNFDTIRTDGRLDSSKRQRDPDSVPKTPPQSKRCALLVYESPNREDLRDALAEGGSSFSLVSGSKLICVSWQPQKIKGNNMPKSVGLEASSQEKADINGYSMISWELARTFGGVRIQTRSLGRYTSASQVFARLSGASSFGARPEYIYAVLALTEVKGGQRGVKAIQPQGQTLNAVAVTD
ncbi:hypothetical protein B0H13DRAFT_1855855 [Mycena leptocephala]|nr:hypothetical protein B0H13DRAFT_1855855 [Mycena leptocephala]